MSEPSRWTDDQRVVGKYEVKQPSAAGSLRGCGVRRGASRVYYGVLKDI